MTKVKFLSQVLEKMNLKNLLLSNRQIVLRNEHLSSNSQGYGKHGCKYNVQMQ